MNAAIYLRVSKDDGSQTVENQRPELESMVSQRGYRLRGIYADRASGAKGREERPELARLMDDAARARVRAVFVWALDRLSRDGTFLGGLLMVGQLGRWGVALVSHQETWLDTAGPFREPLVALSLKLAEEERRRLVARTLAGLQRARAEGKQLGRPRTALSFQDKESALAMRAKGRTWPQVAGGLGVSRSTLLRELRGRSRNGGANRTGRAP